MKTKTVKVGIIILTLNQREKTLRCLESLGAVKSPSFKILLWDNGSGDGTAEAVQEAFPEVIVHYNFRNIGVASGRNEAAKIMSENFNPRYFLFLDNDMTVEPHFLEALIAPFEHSSSLAQTTAKICDLNDHRRLYGAGGCQAQFWRGDTMHVGYGEHDYGQYDNPRKCYPSGGCMLVRADVYEKLGGFDPNFDPYGSEDLDFGLRAQKAGYYGFYVPRAIVYHEWRPAPPVFKEGENREGITRYWSEHWFLLMRRHAPAWQKLVFVFLSGPYLALKVILREFRKGNLETLKELFDGFLAFGKSSLKFQR